MDKYELVAECQKLTQNEHLKTSARYLITKKHNISLEKFIFYLMEQEMRQSSEPGHLFMAMIGTLPKCPKGHFSSYKDKS